MTSKEMDALPESGGYDTFTDPKTGHTTRERRPEHFLLNDGMDGDVLFYTDPRDGSRWIVGRDNTGTRWKQRSSV